MKNIILDISKTLGFIHDYEIEEYKTKVEEIHHILHSSNKLGRDFLGWVKPENLTSKEDLKKIMQISSLVSKENDALVVIGVGGSILGARSVVKLLKPYFSNVNRIKSETEIYYAGDNLSEAYLKDLAKVLENKDFAINLVSLTGSTMEPLHAFEFFRPILEKKYGTSANKHIIITTGAETSLMSEAVGKKYHTINAPENVGGRFSVLSSIGLFPISVAGGNIEKLLEGASDGAEEYTQREIFENYAYLYATVRNILYKHNYKIEIIAGYEPKMHYFLKWWQQLFAESEGKNGHGVFPVPAEYSGDLHSLGQIIQDGERNIFETTIVIGDEENLNHTVSRAVSEAHFEGGVPSINIYTPELNEYYIGKLYYMLEKSCAMSAYLLGVHPFDQPGVEKYKSKIKDLIK